ncbi:MAG: hypothetical protein R2754_18955 [Microthrixaceae bacterium]
MVMLSVVPGDELLHPHPGILDGVEPVGRSARYFTVLNAAGLEYGVVVVFCGLDRLLVTDGTSRSSAIVVDVIKITPGPNATVDQPRDVLAFAGDTDQIAGDFAMVSSVLSTHQPTILRRRCPRSRTGRNQIRGCPARTSS